MPSHSTVTRQQYQEHYDKGLPLWTREDLEDIERQLKERSERMTVKDIDNSFIVDNIDLAVAAADANKLKKILGIGDDVEIQSSYGLIYQSIQSLTDHRHEKAGLPLGPPVRSVQIHAPRHNPLRDLRQIETDHENHQQSWLQSETCKKLQEYLCTADLPRIEKIVAFGLGDFSFHDDGSHHTQHAAIATLAGILKRRQSGHSLQCYVQDPAYSDADKEFLEKRGLVVLRDPQAFLEVDETTLVFTASPNVPVRQVVADLARPAALLWETTPPTLEGEIENFRKDLVQGGDFSETDVNGRPQFEVVEGEHTVLQTDPSSSRVRKMIEHYHAWKFPEDEKFGDLTLYLRKQGLSA